MVSLGDRELPLDEAISSWVAEVRRIHADLGVPGSDPDVWGAHDYLGLLHGRTLIQTTIDRLGIAPAGAALLRLAEGEALLRSFTRDDKSGVLIRFARGDIGEEWWWTRIPTSGPVREELDSFDRQLG